jgi:hypothetical protein
MFLLCKESLIHYQNYFNQESKHYAIITPKEVSNYIKKYYIQKTNRMPTTPFGLIWDSSVALCNKE